MPHNGEYEEPILIKKILNINRSGYENNSRKTWKTNKHYENYPSLRKKRKINFLQLKITTGFEIWKTLNKVKKIVSK